MGPKSVFIFLILFCISVVIAGCTSPSINPATVTTTQTPIPISTTIKPAAVSKTIATTPTTLPATKSLPDYGSGRNGTLAGNVSIGPLCPVEPCRLTEEQLAAAYAARTISVFTPRGDLVARITPDPHTGYSIGLRAGTYTVDIPRNGIGGGKDLPATVIIRANETTRLDISIDTGIR